MVDILKNGTIFAGTLICYGFVELFNAPKSLLGMALLIILEIPNFYVVWICYSIIYWACELPKEDNFILIAITTLAYAALISISILLTDSIFEKNKNVIQVSTKLLTALPVVCNNLLYHPLLGGLRFALYTLLRHNNKDRRNFTGVYLLFSKSETLIPLMIWHGIMEYLSNKVIHPMQLPVVTISPPSNSEVDRLADVIKQKKNSRTG